MAAEIHSGRLQNDSRRYESRRGMTRADGDRQASKGMRAGRSNHATGSHGQACKVNSDQGSLRHSAGNTNTSDSLGSTAGGFDNQTGTTAVTDSLHLVDTRIPQGISQSCVRHNTARQ